MPLPLAGGGGSPSSADHAVLKRIEAQAAVDVRDELCIEHGVGGHLGAGRGRHLGERVSQIRAAPRADNDVRNSRPDDLSAVS
jgi:hypothetical protein